MQQLQQQTQQLQELAAKNSSKPGVDLALADAAATAAAAAGVDLTAGADRGSSGSSGSGSSSSMLWVAKYAPAFVHQLCGNAAAAAAFQTFLSDWKSLIQQHAAAAAAGRPAGDKAAAAESDAETESSWMQSTRSGWASSACDEPAAMGR
jgi:hypothetical protein